MNIRKSTIQLLVIIILVSCSSTTAPNNQEKINSGLVVIQPDSLDWWLDEQSDSNNKIYGVAVSQNEADLAVYTSQGIYLYNANTLELKRFIEIIFNSTQDSLPITFSPDGRHLAFAQDIDIIYWNLKTNSRDAVFTSAISEAPPFYIEFAPSGNRIVLSTYSSSYSTEAQAVNFALYDLQGTLLFNKYLFADHSEYYYRLTRDEKLYIFRNSMLGSPLPLMLDIIDTKTGKIFESITYDFETNSYNAKNVFYDVSQDGQFGAVDLVQEEEHKTMLVNPITRDEIKIIDEGSIHFLPSHPDGNIQWEPRTSYRITGVFYIPSEIVQRCDFGERPTVTSIAPYDGKLILLLPYSRSIQAVEIWDTVNCRLEKGITLADNNR